MPSSTSSSNPATPTFEDLDALAEGVAINPGAEWSTDPVAGRRSLRLCFGHPSADTIEEGVGVLAEVVAVETGLTLPAR